MSRTVDLSPGAAFAEEAALPAGVQETDLELRVTSSDGREIIRYAPERIEESPLPGVARPPGPPDEFATVEELYLAGLHLEQYRHPTIDPEPYWEEALRRDPGDSRTSNAMGLLRLRRGELSEAERHFRLAVERLTERNPNPRDGEPFYNLGLTLRYQGRHDEA